MKRTSARSIQDLLTIADLEFVCMKRGVMLKETKIPFILWGKWRQSGDMHEGPTFKVNRLTQRWFCFSLARGGNVFDFIQEDMEYEYIESVYHVAKLYNFKLTLVDDQ